MGFKTANRNNRYGNRRKKSSISDINITPLVDVLLVLLIIFMVCAPMMTGSVEIDLPKGVSNAVTEKSVMISVSIKEDGSLFLQEESIKIRGLPKRLLEVTANDISSKIYVRADQKIDYGRVMEVVKVINSAGFNQVILVTELNAG